MGCRLRSSLRPRARRAVCARRAGPPLGRAARRPGSGPRDAPARQRTLRATIDWSHRLLSTSEADVFARFSVFAGGADHRRCEEVTGANREALEGLVDNQLLQRLPPTRSRLLMLETVREYARERLGADNEAADTLLRHCLYYLAFAERASSELYTRGEADWLSRLDAEIDNLRVALDWSLNQDHPLLTLRLSSLLPHFWNIRGMAAEGLGWVEAALDAVGPRAPIGDAASARVAQVHLLGGMGVPYKRGAWMKKARDSAAEAVALSRQAGDSRLIADALLAQAILEEAEPLPQVRRQALAEEALAHARAAGDSRLVAYALSELAFARRPAQASRALEEAAAARQAIGDMRGLAQVYFNAAYNALKDGRPDLARPMLDRALPLARRLGDPRELMFVSGNVGLEALFSGDLDRAEAAFRDQLRFCVELVDDSLAPEGLAGLAAIAARRGDVGRAARFLGAAIAIGPIADPEVLAQLERDFFEPARERYGDARWHETQAAGGLLTFEEAVDAALGRASCADET